MNGVSTHEKCITYGVPQGSVLGPKLFLMFINDLVSVIKHCKFFLYADDIVMYKSLESGNNDHDITLFRQDLRAVERWCIRNELTINIKNNNSNTSLKTEILIVNTLNGIPLCNI